MRLALAFRLPFIENADYIALRRRIIKVLVQIRVLLRNLRAVDPINMAKTKLISEVTRSFFRFVSDRTVSPFSSTIYER